jgi:hypothetical protein
MEYRRYESWNARTGQDARWTRGTAHYHSEINTERITVVSSVMITKDRLLSVDLVPFERSVQDIVRKHKLLKDLMVREKYTDSQINHEDDLFEIQLRDLRIKQTTAFQDVLSYIIRSNR